MNTLIFEYEFNVQIESVDKDKAVNQIGRGIHHSLCDISTFTMMF